MRMERMDEEHAENAPAIDPDRTWQISGPCTISPFSVYSVPSVLPWSYE